MQRLLVRIAALALGASALSACSLFGGSAGDNAANAPSGSSSEAIPTDVNAAVSQAQLLRNTGDVQGATRILSQLMLTAPDNASVVGEYGKLLVQEGRPDDAVQFLRRAVELQPNEWSFYSAMGVAYDQLGNQPNAKLAYEHALTLKPNEPAILNNFAMSRMLAGDTVAARALMTRAQASGSTDPKIARNLALLDSMAPVPPAAPARQTAAISAPPALRTAVTAAAIPPIAAPPVAPPSVAVPAAHGAPAAITRGGNRVVMQEVPVDLLAGPTAVRTVKHAKRVRTAHVPKNLAFNAAKPAKPAASDHIPALRMTADATKP